MLIELVVCNFHGLVQDCIIAITSALDILQSYPKPSICHRPESSEEHKIDDATLSIASAFFVRFQIRRRHGKINISWQKSIKLNVLETV